jgi:hypothetical protein
VGEGEREREIVEGGEGEDTVNNSQRLPPKKCNSLWDTNLFGKNVSFLSN